MTEHGETVSLSVAFTAVEKDDVAMGIIIGRKQS